MSNLQTQRRFSALKEKCHELGYLEYSPVLVYGELGLVFALFLAGAYLRDSAPWLAIALATVGGITLVWWIHNAGHDAFFESKKKSKAWIDAMGILFLGMPQIEYHFEVHRRHHGSTNVIGKDGALDTGPVIWSPKMLSEKRKNAMPFQALFWFAFVLPLTWPLINFRCIQTLLTRKAYLRLAALSLRWVAVPVIFEFDWLFILLPILITGFVLGFSASLNHFHMPMDTRPLAPFPASVFLTTQNLSNRGYFATWLTGGLNFHVEHHLFPNVPSYRLRKIAPLVEAFARENNLPYQICGGIEAVAKLNKRLQDPLSVEAPDQLWIANEKGTGA